jgi:hypothetical protein
MSAWVNRVICATSSDVRFTPDRDQVNARTAAGLQNNNVPDEPQTVATAVCRSAIFASSQAFADTAGNAGRTRP